jgi:hypothetical protein
MEVKFMNCTCERIPLENKVKGSKVTSYTTNGSCQACVAQRAIDQVAQAEDKSRQDKAVMVDLKMKDMAEKELKKEGKL